jgi:hypothetical protein
MAFRKPNSSPFVLLPYPASRTVSHWKPRSVGQRPVRTARTRQSEFSFGEAGEDEGFRLFQRCHGVRPAHAGELLQELVESVSAFEVIKQGLKRNTGSAEYGLPAENFRILNDNALRFPFHLE